jgi:hemerythrin-like domain-containing protein
MLHLVGNVRDHRTVPNFDLLGAMVYYIGAFTERFHHPKEDKYLFKALRIRCPWLCQVLDRLQEEHRVGAEKLRTLEQAFVRYRQGGDAEPPAFIAAAESYAAFHSQHMALEEKEVLALAEKHLNSRDWVAIDEAFTGHTDPLFGEAPSDEYDKLFQRILNLRILSVAPRPLGPGHGP